MSVTRDVRIDLHLIYILSVLIKEQSVTRAAVRLNLSQPAVSIALRKLREITNDKILVRGKGGNVLSPGAEHLLASSQRILSEFEAMVSGGIPINGSLKRSFSIGSLDYGGQEFLSRLIEKATSESPQVCIHIKSIASTRDIEDRLETDELDCAITNWASPPPSLLSRKIHEEDFVLVLSPSHPLARRPYDINDILSYPHVAVTSAFQARDTIVDEHLHKLGLRRQIQATVPNFSMLPDVLRRTGLLAIVGRSTANAYKKQDNLVFHDLPLSLPKATLYILWHPRYQDLPEHKWLRNTIAEVWHGSTAMRPLLTAVPPRIAV